MRSKPKVSVIGSINMDLITMSEQVPNKGETIVGNSFYTSPGGKGANQAVAASKLGADVTMFGMIGKDVHGHEILEHFKKHDINCNNVQMIPDTTTGVAAVTLSECDNRIIVIPGANNKLSPNDIYNARECIYSSDIILLQLEIPIDTVRYSVDLAYQKGIPIIVNPAPFRDLPDEIYKKATFLTPNEIELQSIKRLAIYEEIKHKLIITKGSQGVDFINNHGEIRNIPAYKVSVKDTTGAGDTFNGALATKFVEIDNIEEAIEYANASASLSVKCLGAQEGMPTKEEVNNFKNCLN